MLLSSLLGLGLISTARAVTVYGQIPLASSTISAALPTFSANQSAAYDTTILTPPAPPSAGSQSTNFTVTLSSSNASVPGLSILQHGSFFGFSIEMSVVTQLMGKNSSLLSVPFLNFASQIVERAGGLHIRMGGNTQDYAVFVDSIPDYRATEKQNTDTQNPTQTPAVLYSIDFFYIASNITALIPGVHWYLGIPMNDTNWRLEIAELGQAILGENLYGLQTGNEPDYYGVHGHRPADYSPSDYGNEFGSLVQAIQADDNIPIKNMLIAPSLATGTWTPDQFWATGFLTNYSSHLNGIAMEHYPTDNCYALYGVGSYTNPNQELPNFLNHQSIGTFLDLYNTTSTLAAQNNLPFIMFETNTATCGGLPGLSNSFGATLWALDYGLTMAARNFSHALLHFGGQNVFYNAFTAPPSNFSKVDQYTVGSIYYSMLVVAETFGKSNVSQIVDTSNNGPFNPSYAIYDNGNLDKLVFINFIDDPTGANDITGTFTLSSGTVPSQVYVKYLEGPSVVDRTNITWAGQSYGSQLQADGRPIGNVNITTIPCSASSCSIPVKAPSAALVFLYDPTAAGQESPAPTYSTSIVTSKHTATINPLVLATSNGMGGSNLLQMGSTSSGSANGAEGRGALIPGVAMLAALLGGVWVMGLGR